MQQVGVVGNEVIAGFDFSGHLHGAGGSHHLGAHGKIMAGFIKYADEQVIVGSVQIVLIKQDVTAIGHDQYIQIPVPVMIKTTDSTPLSGVGNTSTDGLFGEGAILIADEQPGRVGMEFFGQ